MNKKITILLLALIVFFAALLRLWDIGKVPVSPNWDEAALGYNAYSLAQTGRDEYGAFLPITLRSFDDYKPALYSYIAIPFIKIFGLQAVAVRLPSVLFGIAMVFITFFLVKELLSKDTKGTEKKTIDKTFLALVAAFFVAISPWHIQFSRVAYEANIGAAFNALSVLFFLKSFKKPYFLLLAGACMALNLYVYQSEKIFTPLLLIILVLIYFKNLLIIPKKYLILAVLLGFLLSLPIVHYTLGNPQSLTRFQGLNPFSDKEELLNENANRMLQDTQRKDIIGIIVDNRRYVYVKKFLVNYLAHFDPNWLFTKGEENIPRHQPPQMGHLYLLDLPFLFMGFYAFIFGNFKRRTKVFLFSWMLLVPIPAALTWDVPHSVRTLNFIPIIQIFIALGVILFIQKVSDMKYKIAKIEIKYLVFALCSSFLLFNFLYYLDQYFMQYNYTNSQDWQYGYQEIMPYVLKNQGYKKIVVSNKIPLDQSYIFFLFCLKYPPSLYQRVSPGTSGAYRSVHVFDKYEFREINLKNEKHDADILYIGGVADFPDYIRSSKMVYFLNGKPAIKIVSGDAL